MPPHRRAPQADPTGRADAYAATATAYELFSAPYRPAQLDALTALLPRLAPERGPLLDIGCGPGQDSTWLLDEVPGAVTGKSR